VLFCPPGDPKEGTMGRVSSWFSQQARDAVGSSVAQALWVAVGGPLIVAAIVAYAGKALRWDIPDAAILVAFATGLGILVIGLIVSRLRPSTANPPVAASSPLNTAMLEAASPQRSFRP
jgi:hypothetical protein